jgi:hypothetical protein
VRGTLLADGVGASDVPIQTSIVRVTDERHVLAIGATDRLTTVFDPLLIRWCDQEDPLNWTPASDKHMPGRSASRWAATWLPLSPRAKRR